MKIEEISKSLLEARTALDEFYSQEKLRIISSPAYNDLLKDVETRAAGIQNVPEINSALYNLSKKTGNRELYEGPYDARRVNLSLAAFLVIAGKEEYLTIVEKYLNAICDEETWVIPAHDGRLIDIISADTTLTIAETVSILKDKLPQALLDRVFKEVRERLFDPYEKNLDKNIWYDKGDNWTSVCNSCIGSAYLLLERDQERLSQGVSTAIIGLKSYIDKAFQDDGGTDEGVLYWNYGMGMFTVFAEHLFNASIGSINLFSDKKFKKIAEFPANMLLGKELFISFSDAFEHGTQFHPGYIQKIATKTETPKLLGLLTYKMPVDCYELPNIIRYCTWWDGKTFQESKIESVLLPDLGIAKVVSNRNEYSIVVSTKAGNNGENHNHNDIGSWILTVDGENFITDPGPGKYDEDYFSEKRYENIFANSFGHSVPVIDGELQREGSEYFGNIDVFASVGELYVLMNLTNAYPVKELKKFSREIFLDDDQNIITLTDRFNFSGSNHTIQEAFITFLDVEIVDLKNIVIRGKKYSIKLTIEKGEFTVQELKKESLDDDKNNVLKRISIDLDNISNTEFVLTCHIM